MKVMRVENRVDEIVQLMTDASYQHGDSYEYRVLRDNDFEDVAKVILGMFNWVNREHKEIPKDGREYLVKNNRQGGVVVLVRYDKVHKVYKNKGTVVPVPNLGDFWKPVEIV